jgi:citrate lyase subunit beta/citryl-CoA lyase
MRSCLFVPADSDRKLARGLASGADCLFVDLEDSVAPAAKAAARESARAFLTAARAAGGPALYVRVNALDTGLTDADLDAVMPGAPDGIVLPKAASGADVQQLGAKLAVREARLSLPDRATRIIPIVTETAASLFALQSYAGASPRLAGLTWGAEDLSADLGAETYRLPDGGYTAPFALARTLTLLAAVAAGVAPIDTVFPPFRDTAGFRAECEAARREGFTGKMAIHPDQVPVINEVFTPSAEAVARARAIVAAFADGGTGVTSLDGEMLDQPHLVKAKRLLARGGKQV